MSQVPDFVLDLFLGPGEFYFGDEGTRIRTILGSCVSFTVWHPVRRIGGMNHIVLPSRGRARRPDEEMDGRFADESMEMFLKEIKQAGCKPTDFEVKIFGGGNILANKGVTNNVMDIGTRNIQASEELLKKHGFRVVAEHLGGLTHRQILFEVWSGDVWLKRHQDLDLGKKRTK